MLTAAVQQSPGERREIVILVLFVVSQKEAGTEEHFIKNTANIYRAAAGWCANPCTQDSALTLLFLFWSFFFFFCVEWLAEEGEPQPCQRVFDQSISAPGSLLWRVRPTGHFDLLVVLDEKHRYIFWGIQSAVHLIIVELFSFSLECIVTC